MLELRHKYRLMKKMSLLCMNLMCWILWLLDFAKFDILGVAGCIDKYFLLFQKLLRKRPIFFSLKHKEELKH